MSRSVKKNPIIKDNGQSHRFYKKLSHATTRARVRTLLGNNIPYEDLLFPTQKSRELINQYNICDYKWSPIYSHSWAKTLTFKDLKTYYRK